MLEEYKLARQEPGAGLRRWFQGSGFELIVWLGADLRVKGFQLCYEGAAGQEHALTWREQHGFSHARVDTGDNRPDKDLTPILVVDDGGVPWAKLREDFATDGLGLDPELAAFISARLAEGGR